MNIKIKENKFCNKEELKKLLESRNLFVDDIKILDLINYSHLIHKYGKFYFSEPKNKNYFRNGTKLSHIYNLHLFNNHFSSILFKVILMFEHKLKNSIAYNFASKGELCYLNNDFYSSNNIQQKKQIHTLIDTIKIIENEVRGKYNPKSHYDGILPIWLLIDELSFKELRNLLYFSKSNLKNKIHNDLKIGWKNRSLLPNIHHYQNLICHANPLKRKILIKHSKTTHYLKNFIHYTMSTYKDEFEEIENLFNTYDYSKLNLSKNELLMFLGLENLFNKKEKELLSFS